MRGDSEAPPLEGGLVELQVLAEVHEHNAAALSPRERAAGGRRQPESSAHVAPAPRARRRVAAGLVGLVAAAASESATSSAQQVEVVTQRWRFDRHAIAAPHSSSTTPDVAPHSSNDASL